MSRVATHRVCVSPSMAHTPPNKLVATPGLPRGAGAGGGGARAPRADRKATVRERPDRAHATVRRSGLLAKFPGTLLTIACPVPCCVRCAGCVRALGVGAWDRHRSGGEPKLCTQVSTTAPPASPPPPVGSLALRPSVGALGNLVDRAAYGTCHRRGALGHPDLRTQQRGVMRSSPPVAC